MPRDRLRFSVQRMGLAAGTVAAGCGAATLVDNPAESLIFVMISIGASAGLLVRGPIGAVAGAALTWLLLGVAILCLTFIAILSLWLGTPIP